MKFTFKSCRYSEEQTVVHGDIKDIIPINTKNQISYSGQIDETIQI